MAVRKQFIGVKFILIYQNELWRTRNLSDRFLVLESINTYCIMKKCIRTEGNGRKF